MKRLFSLLLLLAALLMGCSAPSPGGRVVYGLTLAPSGIDPHVNTSSELGIPLTSVYDTLVYLDPETGEFVPGLAQRWEVSDDGLVYTFYLKQGVTFHDGTSFDAEAVRFNLERITSPDLASQKARFMLGPYERAEVVDEYTIRLHLDEPFAPLLDSLSQVYLGMASPAAVEQWGDEYQLHQVGTGPFIFAEYAPGDHLLLRRNPDYAWGPPVYQHDTAQVEEIEFRFFTDPATRSPALETGAADVMGEIPPQDVTRLEASSDFRVEPVTIPGVSLMFFMNTTRPPLDDIRVRQALLCGTDRQAEPLTLDLYLMGWGYMPEVGQLLAAQWAELGVGVNSQVVSFPEALEVAGEGQHHLIPFALSSSDPDILRKFFHSQAGFNWSKVNNAELDGWLEQGAYTSDRAERAALYSQVQLRVMDQALVIPIRDYVNLNGVSKRVQNLRFDAQGWFPWLIDVTAE